MIVNRVSIMGNQTLVFEFDTIVSLAGSLYLLLALGSAPRRRAIRWRYRMPPTDCLRAGNSCYGSAVQYTQRVTLRAMHWSRW